MNTTDVPSADSSEPAPPVGACALLMFATEARTVEPGAAAAWAVVFWPASTTAAETPATVAATANATARLLLSMDLGTTDLQAWVTAPDGMGVGRSPAPARGWRSGRLGPPDGAARPAPPCSLAQAVPGGVIGDSAVPWELPRRWRAGSCP